MAEPYEVRRLLPLVEDEVVVIPATEEKTGNLKWLTAITVVTPSPQEEGKFVVEYRPMTATGEIIYTDAAGKDTTRTITVTDLYSFKKQVPELDAAFHAVLACVNPVEYVLNARLQQTDMEPEP
jgi:hypothetical protein